MSLITDNIQKGDYFVYYFTGGFPNYANEDRKPIYFLAKVLGLSENGFTVDDIKCLSVLRRENGRKISIELDEDYSFTIHSSTITIVEAVEPILKNGKLDFPNMLPQFYI